MESTLLLERLTEMQADPRISSSHIAAYLALYRLWIVQNCPEQLAIKGKDIKNQAKISSSATWHRVIRALSEYGYIQYCPTFNKTASTVVYMNI